MLQIWQPDAPSLSGKNERKHPRSLAMRPQSVLIAASSCCLVTALAGRSFIARNHRHGPKITTLGSSGPGNESNDGAMIGKELITSLARVDESWKIQQRYRPQSRWKELSVPNNDGSSSSTVYLLEPPGSTIPSCLLVFFGGAVLGQFPQVAYNEMLFRISNRLNAAVIAAPYNVGLDHFALAKDVGELARKAILQCEDDRQYPTSLPTYCLAHSLGCKLATIYMAATDQEYEGIGFMSYNNFGFGRTISMAREFSNVIGDANDSNGDSGSSTRRILDQVFDLAESAVSMIGLDFSPNPLEMDRLISLKFDQARQRKTRLFSFDDDTLETTQDFVMDCSGPGPTVSGLEGTHLTPVYFKVDLDEVDDIPPEAREMAQEAMGGLKSFSFGNEEQLQALVQEVCDWILGKGPARPPKWQRELPRIASTSSDGRGDAEHEE